MYNGELVRAAGKIVVSIGVGNILNNAIKATTPNTVGTLSKLTITVGGAVLMSMISDAAERHLEVMINKAFNGLREMGL